MPTHALRPTLRLVALRLFGLGVLVLAGALILACSGDDGGSSGAGSPSSGGRSGGRWDAKSIAQSLEGVPFVPFTINSNLGVGETRIAFALFKPDRSLVIDTQVTARLYRLADQPEQHPTEARAIGSFPLVARTIDVAAEHQAAHRSPSGGDRLDGVAQTIEIALAEPEAVAVSHIAHEGALSTMYTAMVKFDQPGTWGAELDIKTGGKSYSNVRVTMQVLPKTSEPAVGDPAPRSKQPVLRDVQDIAEIDSSPTPHPELHMLTIDEAIASGKPVVAAFVTPAFCQTRFCGPVLTTAVLPLAKQYGDRVHVLHIEPFDLALARKGSLKPIRVVDEWGLLTEPFIVVIDRSGKVAAKFEGIVALEEVTAALDTVLAQQKYGRRPVPRASLRSAMSLAPWV